MKGRARVIRKTKTLNRMATARFFLNAPRSISAQARGGETGNVSFTEATLGVPAKLASVADQRFPLARVLGGGLFPKHDFTRFPDCGRVRGDRGGGNHADAARFGTGGFS